MHASSKPFVIFIDICCRLFFHLDLHEILFPKWICDICGTQSNQHGTILLCTPQTSHCPQSIFCCKLHMSLHRTYHSILRRSIYHRARLHCPLEYKRIIFVWLIYNRLKIEEKFEAHTSTSSLQKITVSQNAILLLYSLC